MRPKFSFTIVFLLFAVYAFGQTRVVDSLKKIIALGQQDSLQVMAENALGNELARSNIAAAKRYWLEAIPLSKKLNLRNTLSAIYCNISTMYAQTKMVDSARYYIDLLKKIADRYNTPYLQSNYYFTEGLFYRKLGNYNASIPYMKEALRLFIIQKDKLSIAGEYLNIGNNYSDIGDPRNAMTYHLDALKIFEELGNERGISFCYSNIGMAFIKLKQFVQAKPYIDRSIAIKKELNDKKGLGSSYAALGAIEENLHHPDKALGSYQDALALDKEIKLMPEEAKVDLDIGKFYAQEKDMDNARKYMNYSLALFTQLRDTAFIAVANAEIANLQKTEARQQTAENTFLKTLNTALKMGDKITELSNYKYLSDFYSRNKQFEKALFYNEKYHSAQDSVQNGELQLQVKRLEQQYNLQRKEKEIALLKKDQLLYKANLQNQKIFRYGAITLVVMLLIIGVLIMTRYRTIQKTKRLLEMEKMRNSIARNLHDDVGSILSSINILSKVALKQADGNADVSKSLERIKSSSYAIMEGMSDIVWAINPDNDSVEKTVLKMKEFAASILEPAGIDFEFSKDEAIGDMKLGVDERKNLYLVFKEAINNIAKYSGATLVNIDLKKNANRFLMKIIDNGKGFDCESQHSGNGLKNMQSRAREMNAVFQIISAPVIGTSISLDLAVT